MKKMNQFKKIFISAVLILIVSISIAAKEKPNVILIMTDDQGYGELSCHGNPIVKTPALDKLSEQSIRFSDFHVCPMCAPTRGQLLTGVDAARNGTVNVSSGRALLRKEIPTMADFFTENGYATGIFGKWHLGDNYPYRPEDRGFQEAIWFPSSHIGSVPDYWGNNYFADTYIHNGKREKFEGYCTDIFYEKSMEYIETSLEKNKPFFIYLPTNTPHWPNYAHEEDLRAIEELYAKSSVANKNLSDKDKKDIIAYLAMVRNIDTNTQKLRDFLKEKNIDKNTILIFLTDNGTTYGAKYYNAGMRGRKTQLWEGGHRVPLFIYYPEGGFTEPRDVNGLVHVQDLLPTLIDLCQLKSSAPKNFDGVSLVPQLRKEKDAPDDRMLVINYSRMPVGFEYPSPYGSATVKKDNSAVMWKRWRLLENRQLYDLAADPMQTTNVIDKYPQVATKMKKHLDKWWNKVKDKANEPQRVIIGSEHENPMMLTGCEWYDVFMDMQVQVIRGDQKNGYWLLDVDRAGTYEFELRRWPREINVPLNGSIGDSKIYPISKARLFIDAVNHHDYYEAFSFEGLEKEVTKNDTSATFTVKLEKGPIALHTWFDAPDGNVLFGAYYVYVKRLDLKSNRTKN